MMSWTLKYTTHAREDWNKAKSSGQKALCDRIVSLINTIQENPWQVPPPWKGLKGQLDGCVSRRIDYTHRLVYQVLKSERTIKVLACWGHYND
jgi:toxin YoeB